MAATNAPLRPVATAEPRDSRAASAHLARYLSASTCSAPNAATVRTFVSASMAAADASADAAVARSFDFFCQAAAAPRRATMTGSAPMVTSVSDHA